jgi:hypothetical protein
LLGEAEIKQRNSVFCQNQKDIFENIPALGNYFLEVAKDVAEDENNDNNDKTGWAKK